MKIIALFSENSRQTAYLRIDSASVSIYATVDPRGATPFFTEAVLAENIQRLKNMENKSVIGFDYDFVFACNFV